jgi:hypothetical protein
MEKYLVIIIVLVLAYYLHNCWVESKIEKFARTVHKRSEKIIAINSTL